MTPKHSEPLRTPATVAAFSVGNRHYERRYNDCGKINCRKCGGAGPRRPSHGPYWYLCVLSRGSWRRIYIGKDLDTSLFVDAQGQVDWTAVKRGRPRKNYTETTNHEVPGQGDLVGDFPDASNTRGVDPPDPVPNLPPGPRSANHVDPAHVGNDHGPDRRTGAVDRRTPQRLPHIPWPGEHRTGAPDRRIEGDEPGSRDFELADGHFSPAGDWIPNPEDPSAEALAKAEP